jgi:hypothetical protein
MTCILFFVNDLFFVFERFLNDTEIAKAQRDFELKKAAYDVEVQTKVDFITYVCGYSTAEHI